MALIVIPDHETAIANIIATITVKDGCNGHTSKIGLSYYEAYGFYTMIGVYKSGCYRLSTKRFNSKDEILEYAILRGEDLRHIVSMDLKIDQEFIDSLPIN
jgi:hypothetical protein